jgi:hypothetical protein
MTTNRVFNGYAIDSALESTAKEIGIPLRPVILDRFVAETRQAILALLQEHDLYFPQCACLSDETFLIEATHRRISFP